MGTYSSELPGRPLLRTTPQGLKVLKMKMGGSNVHCVRDWDLCLLCHSKHYWTTAPRGRGKASRPPMQN